jgi:hypothetical protein
MKQRGFIGFILIIGFIILSSWQLILSIQQQNLIRGILSGVGLLMFVVLLRSLILNITKKYI